MRRWQALRPPVKGAVQDPGGCFPRRPDREGDVQPRCVQEEEGLLKEILAAVKADGSCVKFERNLGQDESSLVPRHYGIYIKSARELSLYWQLLKREH